MNYKKSIIALSTLVAVFALTTPWSSYKSPIWPTVATLTAEQTFLRADTLHIVAKAYTAEESEKYLRKNLIAKGYQPVQITIQNNSANEFSLSSGSVDLPGADPTRIANKMMHSTIPRSIAFRIATMIFWPFVFPSSIDSLVTLKNYKLLKHDLQSKIVKKEVLAPYSIYNRVVFVPVKEFKESFDITLIELNTLDPKIVHIEGLHRGTTVETSSDVMPTEASPSSIVEEAFQPENDAE